MWKKYKLESLAEDIAMGPFGSNIKTDNFRASGVPVIRGKNLVESGFDNSDFVFITEEKAQSLKRSIAYPDELVFTHRGTLGQVGIIPKNRYPYYLVSQSQMRLAVKKDILNSKFLYYFFKSPVGQNELLKNVSQVGVPAIASPTQSLKDVDIEIPDLSTQSRIASMLSSIDDKIELNRRMNQTLEQIARALFNHYFVDNIDPDNLPEGWEIGRLGDVCVVQNGFAFKSKDFADEGSIGVIKIRNISNNIVDIHSTQFIDQHLLNSLDVKFRVLPEDVLIAMTGAEVGKIGIVPHNSKSLWLNQRVGNIKEKNGFGKLFTFIMLTSDGYQSELRTTAMGSAQPNISGTDIENIKIVIPAKETIQNFEIEVKPMFKKLCQNLEEISILATIRDTLLPKLMSGEIDVDSLKKEEALSQPQSTKNYETA